MPKKQPTQPSRHLATAAARGDIATLRAASDLTPVFGENANSLLHIAAKAGQRAVCEFLIKKDPGCVTRLNDADRLAIFEAVEAQQYDIAMLLAGFEGQNAPALFAENRTPLHVLAEQFERNKIAVSDKDCVYGLVSLLARDKAHLNQQDFLQQTPIYAFSVLQHRDAYVAALRLRDAGASLGDVSDSGDTALACMQRYESRVDDASAVSVMSLEEMVTEHELSVVQRNNMRDLEREERLAEYNSARPCMPGEMARLSDRFRYALFGVKRALTVDMRVCVDADKKAVAIEMPADIALELELAQRCGIRMPPYFPGSVCLEVKPVAAADAGEAGFTPNFGAKPA